jgi:membrane associated rhomboid family serine protease
LSSNRDFLPHKGYDGLLFFVILDNQLQHDIPLGASYQSRSGANKTASGRCCRGKSPPVSTAVQTNPFPKPVEQAFHFSQFPWITTLLVLANLGAYAFTSRHGPMEIDEMVRFGGKVGPLVADLGEIWRLLTANFLHRGALHVGLNMFVLLAVGTALENAYRSLDYLWLLLI